MPLYMRVLIAALVVVAVEIAWLSRWDIVPASTEDHPVAYQLDRWTGAVYLLGASENGRVRMLDK